MKKTFRLVGLECANCAAKMERTISKVRGVKDVSVNFLTTKMILDVDEDRMAYIENEAEKIIKKIGPQVVLKKA